MRIEWVHGLEGSPNGKKITAIRNAGHVVDADDYNGLSLLERVTRLEQRTADGERRLLCGSSYGGLTAAIVARRYPERFVGLLLCAPALAFEEPPVDDIRDHVAPEGVPTIVLHSPSDDICPIRASEDYVARSGDHVELVTVDDQHNLEGSLPEVVAAVERLLARVEA
jgi:pimeloyl-ACP methyl ester carboxylesterase